MSARPQIGIIVGSTRPCASADPSPTRSPSSSRPQAPTPSCSTSPSCACRCSTRRCPPASGVRSNPHTIAWAERIDALDGIVFVTPDYNSGYPAALKNAIDYLKHEWVGKPAGIVSYGWAGGAAAAAQLSAVLTYIGLALDEQGVQMAFERGDFDESMRLADPTGFAARSIEPLRALVERVVAASSAALVDA